MADPFATVADLIARWRSLSAPEQVTAEVRLADAAAIIRSRVLGIDAQITDGKLDVRVPKMVSCDMVIRAMQVSEPGASQISETKGPFSKSVSFSNPTGDLYLTKAERLALRPSNGAFSIELSGS